MEGTNTIGLRQRLCFMPYRIFATGMLVKSRTFCNPFGRGVEAWHSVCQQLNGGYHDPIT